MLFGLFKTKEKKEDFTKTKPLIESKEKFRSDMSQKERETLWREKIERERRLARKEEIDEENDTDTEENKPAIRKEAIPVKSSSQNKKRVITKSKMIRGGKALVKHTGHAVEGLGIIANKTADIEIKTAKKIYKHGKPVAKAFYIDMKKTGRKAARGIGNWADRVIEEDQHNKSHSTKRNTQSRKKTNTGLKASPKTINVNGKKYIKHGSSFSDPEDATYYAGELKHAGYSVIIKRLIVQGHKVSVVYKHKKLDTKQHKKTKRTTAKRAKRVIHRTPHHQYHIGNPYTMQPQYIVTQPSYDYYDAPIRQKRTAKRKTKPRKMSYTR